MDGARRIESVRISRTDIAIAAFSCFAIIQAVLLAQNGRAYALVAIATVPADLALRSRPSLASLVMIAGSIILRLGFAGTGYADQIAIAQAAADRAFGGGNPYGVGYAVSTPPGTPFSYGPMGLLLALPGPIVELAGGIGVMGILYWAKCWTTLSLVAALPLFVALNLDGLNDYSAGFVLLLAIVVLRLHPKLGMLLLAVAAAIKPYALAWFLPAIGYAALGWAPVLILAGTSLVLWSPLLLWWGVPSYLRSVAGVERVRVWAASAGIPNGGAINAPALRLLAGPMAIVGLWVKNWKAMVLIGAATFFIFLWTSAGYWIVLIPIVGVALEWRPST